MTPVSLLARRPAPVFRYFLWALGAHVAVVGIGLLVSTLMAPTLVDLNQKPITASLVRKGKPRDQKLLPRKESEAPPAPAKTVPIPTPGVKADNAPRATGTNKSLKDVFKTFGKAPEAAKPPTNEEPEGQEDGDPNGDAAQAEGERYYALLKTQITKLYDVSNTIPESERIRLRTQVLIYIGRGGNLIDAKFAKGSGNDVFDNAVLAAVKKAAPFAPPPEHLRDQLAHDGIVLLFSP
jgi:TonB family protein